MEHAVAIDAAVGVRAEEIALRLGQVGGQPRASIRVVVRERRRSGRHRNAKPHCGLHDDRRHACWPRSPIRVAERFVEQQIDETRVAPERVADVAEQGRADDAAGAPDLRDLAEVDVVAVLGRRDAAAAPCPARTR